jgi:hypothetical protein
VGGIPAPPVSPPIQPIALPPMPVPKPVVIAPVELPKPKKPRVASAENILGKKLEDAKGSNPGGVYEGLDGKRRYVKFYTDPAQPAGEHLANQLYGDLGLGKVKSTLFEHEGRLAYASELMPVTPLGSVGHVHPKIAKKALDGFVADVLTANWDAAGLTLDNLVVDAKGKVYRIDNGGAFLSRAKAGRKPSSALGNVTEWERLFDPATNPGYARLAQAAGVSRPEDFKAQVVKGIEKVVALRAKHGGWRAYVEKRAKGIAAPDREQMISMLEARTQFLEGKLVELKLPKQPAPAKPALPPAKPLDASEFAHAKRQYQQKEVGAATHLKMDDRIKSLREYTGSAYDDMNELLRKTEAAQRMDTYSKNAALRRIKELQGLLSSAKASGYAIEGAVYRGIGAPPALIEALRAGGEVAFDAFSSTSVSPSTAYAFSRPKKPDQVRLIFRIRQRSAVPINMVSSNPGESEALLPAGIRFRIVGPLREEAFEGASGKPVFMVDLEEL